MIDDAPLWLVGLLLLAAMLLAREGGLQLHRRLRRLADASEPGSSDESYVMSGVFGLLALLMAFAFSLALDRYEERRALVVAEANAIGTLASRLHLLGADEGALHRELSRYAAARASAGRSEDPEQSARLFAKAEGVHDAFGAHLFGALARGPADARTTLLVQAYDSIGDIATERRAARAARLPGGVLALLMLYCVIGAGMLGYTLAGGGGRHRLASGIFFALLAFAFVTILDLDRPRGGAIKVPQIELERVARSLAR